MSKHEHSDPSSDVYQHNITVWYKIDFENVKIHEKFRKIPEKCYFINIRYKIKLILYNF